MTKNKISKKADTREIIYAVIGIVLLVAVVIYLILNGKPALEKIELFLGFKTPEVNNTQSQILRYDIANNKVQYYDKGTQFIDFPEDWTKEIPLGDKKVSHGSARYSFAENYYFKKELRDPVKIIDFGSVLRNILREKLYPTQEQVRNAIPALDGCILVAPFTASVNSENSERANVQIYLIAENSKCVDELGSVNIKGGVIKVEINGEVKIRRIGEVQNGQYILENNYVPLQDTATAEIFRNFANEWRDSVLSQPMQFKYDNNQKCILVEVEKASNGPNKYLKIDLSKPVGTC